MAYTTKAKVRSALVPTADGAIPASPSHTAADLSDAQIDDHIAEADAVIDGYLAKWYTTPVAPSGTPTPAIPHPVDYWSRDIAAYLATCTYRGSMDFTDNDPVARRYKMVMDALKDVASGKMTLPLPGAPGAGDTGSGSAGSAINPYRGDLWTPDDFSISPGDDGSARLPYWSQQGPWSL